MNIGCRSNSFYQIIGDLYFIIYIMITVPDLPQGQLGPGPGPEIQGAQNHASLKIKRKKERKKKEKKEKKKEQEKKKNQNCIMKRGIKRFFYNFVLVSSVLGTIHEHLQRRSQWKLTEIMKIWAPLWNSQT